jgi:D-3-phosphoglycerate dehydrogenase / 2-oxoglutarate reductase
MMNLKVLITCPPMQRSIARYTSKLRDCGIEPTCPTMTQILSESELIALVPEFDGWIIGDDPATERVFRTGTAGRLRAAVKWGAGVDNVDFSGANACGLKVPNTPGMFDDEVADIAIGYVVALARETFAIDRSVKSGGWHKPVGMSLRGKTVAVVGFGGIGRATVRRLLVSGMHVNVYDPVAAECEELKNNYQRLNWPDGIQDADFIVLCCALNNATRDLINRDTLGRCKRGVRIVNVSRGPVINELSLVEALETGGVHSAALEVSAEEPLPAASRLRNYEQCIFGSHNASNTQEAVDRTSFRAIDLLAAQFSGKS